MAISVRTACTISARVTEQVGLSGVASAGSSRSCLTTAAAVAAVGGNQSKRRRGSQRRVGELLLFEALQVGDVAAGNRLERRSARAGRFAQSGGDEFRCRGGGCSGGRVANAKHGHEAVDTIGPMVVHETFREQTGPVFCRQEAAVNQSHIFRSDARSGKGLRRVTEKRFQPRVRGREIVGLTGEGIVARSDD